MPRPPRLEPAGVPLHVVQRGNNRTACFFADLDRRFYLKCLADAAARRRCSIHAYVLMTNHVHLLVTPETAGGVSLMLQDVGRKYVTVINKAHGRTGTLWEGRFRSSLVDTENYFLTCHRYIELNPVRAGMVANPAEYPWSSHRHYAISGSDRLITEHPVYVALGSDATDRRRNFLSAFDTELEEETLEEVRAAVNKGCVLGTEAFLDQLEATLGTRVRPPKRGRPTKQKGTAEGAAEESQEKLF